MMMIRYNNFVREKQGKVADGISRRLMEKQRQVSVIIIIITRPRPAFGQLGLGGSLRGYSSYRLTSHASLRACGAHLGGK